MRKREGPLGVVRDDLCVLLRALSCCRFQPARVMVVNTGPLCLRKRRVRDVADETVPEDERGSA